MYKRQSSDTEAGKPDAETAEKPCSSTEKGRTSDRSRATRNTMLATKVVGFFGKPSEEEASSTVSEDGNGTSIQAGEDDQKVDGGARNSSSTFPPEATPTKSDQSLNSPDSNKEIPANSTPSNAKSSPTNAESSSPAVKSETVKPDDKTSSSANKKQKSQTSDRSRATRNAMLATKAVGGFEKPTGNQTAKPGEVKKSSMADTKSNPDTPSAAPDMETARTNVETTGSPELTEDQTHQVWLQHTSKSYDLFDSMHKSKHPTNCYPATVYVPRVEGLRHSSIGQCHDLMLPACTTVI